jgi:hypothetical protein
MKGTQYLPARKRIRTFFSLLRQYLNGNVRKMAQPMIVGQEQSAAPSMAAAR